LESNRQADGRDWEHPYYDVNNTSFNPQTTINKTNVRNLRIKWECELVPEKGAEAHPTGTDSIFSTHRVQTIPLVIGGSIFVADGRSTIYSFDGSTGRLRWRFAAKQEGDGRFSLIHTLNSNGGLVYMVASNCVLYGVDPASGKVRFQADGILPDAKGYYGRAAPSFYRRTAIMAAATAYEATARGCVASYNLDSKKVAWRWFSVPPAVPGPKNWDVEAHKGNMRPYPDDWGDSDMSGRGGVWSQTAVDEGAGRVYFGTGDPDLFLYEGSTVPGPLLYTDCIVSLDSKTGEMVWYHQTTPHDLVSWDLCWSVIIAETEIDGTKRKAIIGVTKGNHVYVLDAATGKPLYEPVRIGHNNALLNANKGNDADMQSSLKPGIYCPGHVGGINAPPAFAYNTIYVATQRIEQRAEYYDGEYRGKKVRSVKLSNTSAPQYSTIYAIDVGRGEVKWTFFISNLYHGAGLTVSGGVTYGVDRKGTLYMLDAMNGELLRSEALGGIGTAGVSIAASKGGEMCLFVPVSGAEGSPNKLLCFGLPS
jgi:glucose dehydrogenase